MVFNVFLKPIHLYCLEEQSVRTSIEHKHPTNYSPKGLQPLSEILGNSPPRLNIIFLFLSIGLIGILCFKQLTSLKDRFYMLKSIITISSFFLLLLVNSVGAQDTLTVFMTDQEITVDDTQVTIPFSVLHFDSISYFQFSFEWDTNQFEFGSVADYNLVGLDESRFNLSEASITAGKVGMIWIDPDAQSTTLEDSVQIFSLTLSLTSNERTDSEIKFADDPTPQEAGDVNGSEIPIKTIDAIIDFVEQSTSTGNLDFESQYQLEQNVPNPFTDKTTINFHLPKSEEVLFEVFDVQGRKVYKKKSRFPQGNNNIELNKLQLNGSGVYQYSISINQKIITKKLVLMDR